MFVTDFLEVGRSLWLSHDSFGSAGRAALPTICFRGKIWSRLSVWLQSAILQSGGSAGGFALPIVCCDRLARQSAGRARRPAGLLCGTTEGFALPILCSCAMRSVGSSRWKKRAGRGDTPSRCAAPSEASPDNFHGKSRCRPRDLTRRSLAIDSHP